jgi:Brp/Blh family beta-carotene 15,15'-monooxygenase
VPSAIEILSFRERLLTRQAWLYCGLTCAVLIALLVFPTVSLSAQVMTMVPLVVLLGLPHGTTDVWTGQHLFGQKFRRYWWIPFGSVYLLLSGFVVFAWSHFPEPSLWSFLIASTVHFGTCDSASDWDGGARILNVVSRGLAPITLPTVLHTQAVGEAFQALGISNPDLLLAALRLLAVVSIFGLIVTGVRNYIAYKDSRRVLAFEPFFEIGLLVLSPPILGFGISFAFLHSCRHMIDVWTQYQNVQKEKIHYQALYSSLIVWLLTVILASALFVYNPVGSVPTRLIYMVFVGLAALTLPHMILEFITDTRRRRFS